MFGASLIVSDAVQSYNDDLFATQQKTEERLKHLSETPTDARSEESRQSCGAAARNVHAEPVVVRPGG